jgi:cell division septal protein FtsQ
MWFNRKQKNRRLGRDHVLDVKVRFSQVRAARTRLAALVFGAVFAIVFGTYLVWRTGGWMMDSMVYENPAFAIGNLDVQTDGVIAPEQLRLWAGVRVGENLIRLDLARVKRDLELVPFVQSVSIERILPHTLSIRVIEREPLAQVNVPRLNAHGAVETTSYELDADGHVLLPLERGQRAIPLSQPPDQLPVISGVNTHELQPGRRIESLQLQAALQLVSAFEHSPMAGVVEIKRINVSSPEILEVLTDQGSAVTFGLTELDQQLRRWHDIFEAAQKQGKAIATLDLAVTNNIPARWLEASAVLPASPKLPKPFHRKKHV